MIECHYAPLSSGETSHVVAGSDPFLSDSITADGGQRANLMSYIKRSDTSHDDSLQFVTPGQLEVVRLSGVAPVRLNLRNHHGTR